MGQQQSQVETQVKEEETTTAATATPSSSTAPPAAAAANRGSDCVNPFVALQDCIKSNPNAFSKDILEDDTTKNEDGDIKKKEIENKKEEKPSKDNKIRPPLWSVESRYPKQKH